MVAKRVRKENALPQSELQQRMIDAP